MSTPKIEFGARRIANCGAMALVIVTLVSSLFSGLGAAASVSPAGLGGTPRPLGDPASGWIPDVPAVSDAVHADRNPTLTTAASGDVLMAYETDVSGTRDIYFTRSTDGGQTWGAPVPVAASGANEVSPSITTDPFSGRIFVTYQQGTSGPTSMYLGYSDDGVSWTIVDAFDCGVYCERPRIVSEYWNGASNNQYIVFAGQIAAGTDWDLGIVRSTNQGLSWTFMYESGLGSTDIRHHPVVAVQHGTDGADRVLMFYRYGSSIPGTSGRMEWSTNYGASWNGPSLWAANVDTPPLIAASHDGDSVMIAYGSGGSSVIWAADSDPTNLVWGGANTFWGSFASGGAGVALGVDGAGSTSLLVGGAYHLVSQFAGGPLSYETAPVSLTGSADWSGGQVVSDSAALPSSAYPELAVTSMPRNTSWAPGVAWTDDRAGSNDIYYTTPGGIVGPGPLTVTINSAPSGLRVSLDGSTRISPAVYSVAPGFHTVSVLSPQPGAPGWRYIFTSWSDGGAISHAINVSANTTISVDFATEVYLTVNSALGGTTGAGWYALGTMATATVTSPQTGPPGTQYLFTSWTGDVTSALTSVTLTMDRPKSITANWQTQYFLTVNSARGGTTGGGWYDDSATATVTVTSPQAGATGTRYLFTQWTGAVASTATTITILMNAPRGVTANWQTQYLMTVISAHGGVAGGGWWNANMLVLVLANSTQPGPSGTRYAFNGWSGDASGTGTGAYVTMDAPKTVVANWIAEYQVTVVSTHGKIAGGGWYRQGTTASIGVTSTEVLEGNTTWVFAGWTGGVTSATPWVNLTVDGPKTLTANWQEKPSLATTGLVIVGPIVLLVALLLVVALLRRRRKRPAQAYTPMQLTPTYGTPMAQAPPPTMPPTPQPPVQSPPATPPTAPPAGPPS